MNIFKKDGIERTAFLLFILAWIFPLFGYAQQLPIQLNIPLPLLQKLQGPQALKQRLFAQRAKASQKQSPAENKPKCPNCDKLLEKARKHGSVRVMIGLYIDGKPEHLLTPEEAHTKRGAITKAQDDLMKRMDRHKVTSVKRLYRSGMAMTVDETGLKALITDPEVSGIGEDQLRDFMLHQSVPLVGADQAWASGLTGTGYTIAIVDSGVDSSHTFLTGKVVAEACFSTSGTGTSPYDGLPYTITPQCPNGLTQQIGIGAGVNCNIYGCTHGTHLAGIAAGKGKDFSGVAKDANIIAIQVASGVEGSSICFPNPAPCAKVYDTDVINALRYIYDLRNSYNIAAVNLSLGGGSYTDICDGNDDTLVNYKSAIDALRGAGIATIAASGNRGCGGTGCSDAIAAPACLSSAISVGATAKYDTVPNWSNSASFLSLLAPGGAGTGGVSDIFSSVPGGGFDYMAGTSMAAPHVSGAFAVLKQQSPTASVDDILSILQSSGVDVLDTRNNITKPRINLVNTPWAARYSGPGRMNEPTAIATDATGNVYVTGLSCTDEMCSRFDYATIKYSPIGAKLWARRYSGGVDSIAFALAADIQGNVYIAGYVCQYIDPSTYNCDHADYVTIKYDTNGNQLWTATYNEGDISWPTAINVDTSGQAYVTGYSCAGTNCFRSSNPGDNITAYATVKYDTNGNQLWAKRYGYTQGYDWATALALDGSGNVYVTGSSCSMFDRVQLYCYAWDGATIKYDINGNQLWVARYPDMWIGDIAVDTLGSAYISGSVLSSDGGNITVKYDSSNGNQLWVASYGMGGGATDIAVDGSGNVYVTGNTLDPTFSFDEYATIKYDTNGNQLWAAIYSDFGSASATHVAVDTAENVYVTGNSGARDYVTLKYDSNGNKVWMARHFVGDHGAFYYDPALSVHGENVYITGPGCVDSICYYDDYLTLKYTP